jgi:hypothetical protein
MTANELRHLPIPLLGLWPPYDGFRLVSPAALPEAGQAPGFIMVLEVNFLDGLAGSDDTPLEHQLRNWIPLLRRAVPCAPVVVRFASPAMSTRIHLAAHALRMGARAVLMAGEPVVQSLRSRLTNAATFAADIAEWLELVDGRHTPRTLNSVSRLIHAGVQNSSLDAALLSARLSERTARRQFSLAKLPSAGHFVRLGYVAPVILDLQRRNGERIESILRDHGALTTESLRRRVSRLLGATPAAIRTTMGWEWWVDRFLNLSGQTGSSSISVQQ